MNILDQLQQPSESDHDFLVRRGWEQRGFEHLYFRNAEAVSHKLSNEALAIQALEDLPKVAAEITRFRSMIEQHKKEVLFVMEEHQNCAEMRKEIKELLTALTQSAAVETL